MKDLMGLRVCRTAYLAHLRPVWFRCGAVPNGPRENGARKPQRNAGAFSQYCKLQDFWERAWKDSNLRLAV